MLIGRIIRTAMALRREGFPKPWRMSLSLNIKTAYFPHRTYLSMDSDGFFYRPRILQWRWGNRLLWEDTAERLRQRAERPTASTQVPQQ